MCSVGRRGVVLIIKHLKELLVTHHSKEDSKEDRGYCSYGCGIIFLLVVGKCVFRIV